MDCFASLAMTAPLLLAFVSLAFAAFTFPVLTGRVVDQANILPAATRTALESKLATLEDRSGIQLVVATVSSLQGSDIESYGVELARAWKIGEAKKNNGLVLLVAPNERKVRIEVGYGLEGTMTDALSSVIIQSAIIPKFRSGDFAGGVSAGVDAIIDALTVDSADWQAKAKVRVDQQPDDQIWQFLIFMALFIFIVYMMSRNARGPTGRWVRTGNNTIFIPTSGGWSGGSGGGGFSDSGGGGFSGGGGSFGGGGASGGW
jgi:uncharacterized protein